MTRPYGTRLQKSATSSHLFVERSPITGQIEVVAYTRKRHAQSAQCLVTTDKCLTHKAKDGTERQKCGFISGAKLRLWPGTRKDG